MLVPRDAAAIQRANNKQGAAHAAAGNDLVHEELGKSKAHVGPESLRNARAHNDSLPDQGACHICARLKQKSEEQPGGMRVSHEPRKFPLLAE